jgi:hypothetical protein
LLSRALKGPSGTLTIAYSTYISLCYLGYLLTCSPDLQRVDLKLLLFPFQLISLLFRISFYLLFWAQKVPSESLTIANSTYLFLIQDIIFLALLISEGSFWNLLTIYNSTYLFIIQKIFFTCSPDLWRVLLTLWLMPNKLISLLYRISPYLLSWSPKGTFETLTLSSSTYLFLLNCSPEPWRVLLRLWLFPIKLISLLFRTSPYLLSWALKCPAKSLTIANSIYVSLCFLGYLLTCSPDLWRVLLTLWLLPNKLISLLFRISPYLLSW